MKAYVLHRINGLSYEEAAQPDCPDGWAIVQIKAAGVCSSDIPRIFTKGAYHYPLIPGHECSGVVVHTANPTDQQWLGKRVGIFPLIPCHTCPQCSLENYEMCTHYDYIGSRRDGGFSELAAVPVWNLIEIPASLSYEEAAMLEPLAVALHAVRRGSIRRGDTVGVIGTGMIGFAAAQWAKRMGASRVCIVGRNQQKRRIAEQLSGIEYMAECGNKPVFDAVIEAVGSSAAVGMAMELTQPGGRVVLMGNPSGTISLKQDAYWQILRKQLHITGSWNSSYRQTGMSDWSEACHALAANELCVKPLISHTFSQSSLEKGLQIMREHTEPYCKILTLWNENR